MNMWPYTIDTRVKMISMEQENEGKGLGGVFHIMTYSTSSARSAEPTCASLTVSLFVELAMHSASMLPGSCKH